MNDFAGPQRELDELQDRTDRSIPPDHIVEIRALRYDEDGTLCISCRQPIHFRPRESGKPRKLVAVMYGGALCCSQQCVEVEAAMRDNDDAAEWDKVDDFIEEQHG